MTKAIKIGADPEFCFKSGQKLVAASEIVGYDDQSELGTDMQSETAEIRPNAGNYWQVTRTISRILTQAARFGYKGYAGSGDKIPLGGHIHFSGVDPNPKLLKKLNKFIATPLNTVSMPRLRRQHGYGGQNCDDTIRYNHHGWEYRASASWLSTPILTKGALAIAWVLARAKQNKDLDKIKGVEELIAYATKTEAVSIRLFFDAISNYRKSNMKLEHIEMFAAWKKSGGKRPLLQLKFDSWDHFMDLIKAKANQYKCRYPLSFYGYGGTYSLDVFAVTVNERYDSKFVDFLKKRLKDLNIHIVTQIFWEKYQIGLSYALRKDTYLCVETVKRIADCFNEYKDNICVE